MEQKKNTFSEDFERVLVVFQTFLTEPLVEIARGLKEKSLPFTQAMVFGCILSGSHYVGLLTLVMRKYGIPVPHAPRLSSIFGVWLLLCGLYAWGIVQVLTRRNLQKKLNRVFLQAGLKTKLEEFPIFVFDRPIGSVSRKLRVRAQGIPISHFRLAKEFIESGLNITVSKLENPKGNSEFVDVNYSLEKMPEGWILDKLWEYKGFSFPVGKSLNGEIKTSLRKVPHFLIAGETGSGKSTFIRALVSVLTLNNTDLRTLFIDMKGGMENQVFQGFDRIELLSEIPQIDDRLTDIVTELEARMDLAAKGKFKNIDEYNQKQKNSKDKWDRILVVVDEAAEIVPTVSNPEKGRLGKIQSRINRFARLGRAVGIHVVIGVQKPDHKNLDPTIKANLPGIICFPVSHFSQSVLVLGNAHAAELNADFPGRGIWKYGSNEIEIQAPFLTQEDLDKADKRKQTYFQFTSNLKKEVKPEKEAESSLPSSYKA